MKYAFPVLAAAALSLLPLTASRSASAQAGGFSDVPKTHWAATSVDKLATKGIIVGSSSTPLSPKAQQKPAAKKAAYDGSKPVTRYELAVTLYRFVTYFEKADQQKKMKQGAKATPKAEPKTGAEAVQRLIAEGYLPSTTPLAKEGNKPVTADQMSVALAQVIAKSREKTTPITPDSLRDTPLEKPANAPGT
jgi:hypothetical protein